MRLLRSAARGTYQGFRATGGIMQGLARVDHSLGGAVRTDDPGYLGRRGNN